MPAVTVFNDGGLPYGCRKLSITANGGSTPADFVAEQYEIDEPSSKLQQRDELNKPSGQVVIPDFITGSATIQVPAAGTLVGQFDTFTADTVNYYVTDVTKPEGQGELKKQRITFAKKISAT